MTPDEFEGTLRGDAPPPDLSRALRALWHAGRDEWDKAHGIVQEDESDPVNAWVHAHLHRVEGDLGNAGYWYRQAGKPRAQGDLRAEWHTIVAALLGKG